MELSDTYQIGVHLGNSKPAVLVEADNAIWAAIFFMSIGRMSSSEAINFIKENINWESVEAQCSQGSPDTLNFFIISKCQAPLMAAA